MPMTTKNLIAYFGPDGDDPAVRRRVAQWRHGGFAVLAFAFSRLHVTASDPTQCISLGHLSPQSRLARIFSMALACLRLFKLRRRLVGAQIFIARNIDNLLLALIARWLAARRAPLIYEVLDINSSCTAEDWHGRGLRVLEKWALRHVDLLVVSSPHFITSYYHERLNYRGRWFLFENKVPKYAGLQRGVAGGGAAAVGRRPGTPPWRIGWFGYLDDEGSWNVLKSLAERLPDQVEIYVRGLPYTNFDMPRFLADVARLPNVEYGGGFANPDDLAEIYGAVDLVWSIDCNDLQANSKWLLTNSVYEAGYLQKPVLALRNTAVGEFVAAFGFGWCLDDPIEEHLSRFIAELSVEEYTAKVAHVAGLTAQLFCETNEIDEVWSLIEQGVGAAAVSLTPHPRVPAT
ncbi:MAG: glycosyltransferase [Alphaproteobacteria bacterium]|nr:glycosyltransferase [Alphaproteobacteria bacterium]